MDTSDVTRFEIIDHSTCDKCSGHSRIDHTIDCDKCGNQGLPGRQVIMRDENKQVDIELQDDGRTLKVFIHPRYEE